MFVVKVKVKHGAPLREPGVSRAHPPLRSAGASLTALGGAFARQPHTAFSCVVAVMMSALKNNASSYLAGRSGGARKPALWTRIFATPGDLADEGRKPSQMEQALRCQRELDESNGECDDLRELVVSLHLEL